MRMALEWGLYYPYVSEHIIYIIEASHPQCEADMYEIISMPQSHSGGPTIRMPLGTVLGHSAEMEPGAGHS